MKFERTKIDDLENPGQAIVTYNEEEFRARIVASRRGIKIEAHALELCTQKSLQDFAEVISRAWKDHQDLKPKIMAHWAGH